MARKVVVFLISVLVFSYFFFPEREETVPLSQNKEGEVEVDKGEEITPRKVEGDTYFSIKELSNLLELEYQYDDTNRKYLIEYKRNEYVIPYNFNYIMKNKFMYPLQNAKGVGDDLLLKSDVLKNHFSLTVYHGDHKYFVKEENNEPYDSPCIDRLEEDDIKKRMDNANIPLVGSHVTNIDGQLPGADRGYRNGIHEGVDWYPTGTGPEMNFDTNIKPIYEGWVVRADHGYNEISTEERNKLLDIAANSDKTQTPDYILDIMRGRQVWIQSTNGTMVRYAHLSDIEDNLEVGSYVTTDQVIGKTGNSGTSNGAAKTAKDIHLHSDIYVCGENYINYFDSLEDAREILYDIFK